MRLRIIIKKFYGSPCREAPSSAAPRRRRSCRAWLNMQSVASSFSSRPPRKGGFFSSDLAEPLECLGHGHQRVGRKAVVAAAVTLTVLPKRARLGLHVAEELLYVAQKQAVLAHLEQGLQAQIRPDKGVDLGDLGHFAVSQP